MLLGVFMFWLAYWFLSILHDTIFHLIIIILTLVIIASGPYSIPIHIYIGVNVATDDMVFFHLFT